MIRLLLAVLAILVSLSSAIAQNTIVFKNAMIYTGIDSTPIKNGTLVVREGKVRGIIDPQKPADLLIEKGWKETDLQGATIIPGLVDTHSHIGIYPKPSVPAHQDGNEMSGPVQPSGRALDAIWPADPGIRMAQAGGVTTANIMPGSGNVIGGQTLYVKLRGRTVEAMRLTPAAVLGGLKMANGEN